VDAAFGLTASGSAPEEAAELLVPWRAALRPGNTAPTPEDKPSGTLCPHGHEMGKCPFIVCKGHFLGGMDLGQN
jgi:hypothetical protein